MNNPSLWSIRCKQSPVCWPVKCRFLHFYALKDKTNMIQSFHPFGLFGSSCSLSVSPSRDLDQVLINWREGKEAPHSLMNTSSVLQVTWTVYNVSCGSFERKRLWLSFRYHPLNWGCFRYVLTYYYYCANLLWSRLIWVPHSKACL